MKGVGSPVPLWWLIYMSVKRCENSDRPQRPCDPEIKELIREKVLRTRFLEIQRLLVHFV